MSNLKPALIGLDKGLNLQTAKLVAPAGSVLDTLNYEQVDFQGQKRIDGFVRYDGGILPAIKDFLVITLTDTYVPTGTGLVSVEGGLLGRAISVDDTTVYVAVINDNLIPISGDTLYAIDTDGTNVNGNVVDEVAFGADSGLTVQEHYDKLLEFMQWSRDNVEELPGAIIGLHWFRDRLYAVADVVAVSVVGTSPVVHPNDEITLDGGETVKVLDARVLDGTQLLFIKSMNPAPWAVEGTVVSRGVTFIGEIANGFEDLANQEMYATFYESRSEAQVLEEDGPSGPYDFGWRFVDQGWNVNFDNGLSLFGSLPSLNQNITGIGTQGPTSVSGDNGRPLILLQSVNITNRPEQVNGWKSSGTPNTYELETDNLIEVDDDTIYADAYISWDGVTEEVSAPGYTDDVLVEYPATNTIVVDIP
jgi:hypothetical protein